MDPTVTISIAIDEARQRREGQIEPIDRMHEQNRIAFRRFDQPWVTKLDEKPVRLEQRRSRDLTRVVKSNGRAREIEFTTGWQVTVPRNFPVLKPDIAHQWDQEAARHGVDDRRTPLDRILLALIDRVEGLRRHRLQPGRQA